ncbi:MAG: hypothetical protein RLZ98_1535 [Pseudomonadota bacterium]|jgi:cytoskeletal protein CcmA (bactofilin family)
MFTRSSDRTPPPVEPVAKPATPPPAPPRPAVAVAPVSPVSPSGRTSLISKDLTIIGSGLKIVSKGTVNIEGRIVGDVIGTEILIGEEANVSGLVNAESVVVRGSVSGTIKAVNVTLAATAKVEGEVHHQSLTIEQGALFEGKSRRATDPNGVRPDLDAAMHDASAAMPSVS